MGMSPEPPRTRPPRLRIAGAVAGLLIGTTAAVLGPAAPASANVPGLQWLTASSNTDSLVYKAVTVNCPAGTVVVGGGYSLVGAEGSVVLDDFIPTTTTLRVGAGEIVGPGEPADGTTASWQVVASVACANPLPGYEIVEGTFSFGAFTRHGNSQAICPNGKHVIGGGESLSNGFGQISPDELFIADTLVHTGADADEDGYSGTWSMTAYAICATGMPVDTRFANDTGPASPNGKAASVSCDPGELALGVGWYTSVSNSDTAGQVVVPSVNRVEGSPGTVTATGHEDPNGYSGNWLVTAEAVCALTSG